MRKPFFSICAITSVFLIQGCGTITRGSTNDVAINVKPAHAKVTSTIGHSCTGTCVINVPRKKEFTLTASAPGYQTKQINVETRVSGKGAAGMAGNLLIGGIIGVGVDAATGATLDHYPNPVNFKLEPDEGAKAPLPGDTSEPPEIIANLS